MAKELEDDRSESRWRKSWEMVKELEDGKREGIF